MSEWKELDINNLPSDILVGDYEWQIQQGFGWEGARAEDNPDFRIIALQDLKSGKKYSVNCDSEDQLRPVKYRYRKRAPKAPTHEEILKPRFWLGDYKQWAIVRAYNIAEKLYHIDGKWHDKEWFTGRESADIPPEAK